MEVIIKRKPDLEHVYVYDIGEDDKGRKLYQNIKTNETYVRHKKILWKRNRFSGEPFKPLRRHHEEVENLEK